MFYLTAHSTHFTYDYMASDIWLRTILIVRKETCCRHIGYSLSDLESVLHIFEDFLALRYSKTVLSDKEGHVLFNDALNTFYLRLYGVTHMVKDHSDSERENPLPPHRLLFPISSKGSFICIIPQTG